MIKKISVLMIACFMPSLHGEPFSIWFEIKPGYFFFSHQKLREIYHGGPEIQSSVTYPVYKIISLYGSIGYVHTQGKSLHAHQKTSIFQIPLDIGLRAIINLHDCVKSYVSMGPRYFYFHQNNHSIYVNRNIRESALGFFINGGFNFIKNSCLLGIFGEYAFEQKSFKSMIPNVFGRKNVQVGGFTFGGTIGCVF